MLHIVLRVILIGIVVSLCALTLAMPRIGQLRSAFYLVLGLSFMAAGLFIDSWLADVFGTRHTPIFRQYGAQGARLIFLLIGLVFIALGGASLFQ